MFSSAKSQTPRDRRNLRWIAIIQVIWLACLIANGTAFRPHLTEPVRVLLALLPLVAGALVIWSYTRFVRDADDLQKAIQLSALAIGFGVSVVFTLAYPPLERIGWPHLESNHFAGIGVLAYALAIAFYSIRYE